MSFEKEFVPSGLDIITGNFVTFKVITTSAPSLISGKMGYSSMLKSPKRFTNNRKLFVKVNDR